MNKDQVLSGMYSHLVENIPLDAFNIILRNDIRVENFFSINAGVYLESLMHANEIENYNFQHTILLENPQRVHVDVSFTDGEGQLVFLELKHFSISQNRGGGRRMSFYTSNSNEGKKVGIVGDCEKLDKLRAGNYIDDATKLVCCAFITQKPTDHQIDDLQNRTDRFPELDGWKLILPVNLNDQQDYLGMITLQK